MRSLKAPYKIYLDRMGDLQERALETRAQLYTRGLDVLYGTPWWPYYTPDLTLVHPQEGPFGLMNTPVADQLDQIRREGILSEIAIIDEMQRVYDEFIKSLNNQN